MGHSERRTEPGGGVADVGDDRTARRLGGLRPHPLEPHLQVRSSVRRSPAEDVIRGVPRIQSRAARAVAAAIWWSMRSAGRPPTQEARCAAAPARWSAPSRYHSIGSQAPTARRKAPSDAWSRRRRVRPPPRPPPLRPAPSSRRRHPPPPGRPRPARPAPPPAARRASPARPPDDPGRPGGGGRGDHGESPPAARQGTPGRVRSAHRADRRRAGGIAPARPPRRGPGNSRRSVPGWHGGDRPSPLPLTRLAWRSHRL